MYGKSFSARLDEVLSMDLAINLKSLIAPLAPANMIYLYFLRVNAGAGPHQEGASVRNLQTRCTLRKRTSARSFQS